MYRAMMVSSPLEMPSQGPTWYSHCRQTSQNTFGTRLEQSKAVTARVGHAMRVAMGRYLAGHDFGVDARELDTSVL